MEKAAMTKTAAAVIRFQSLNFLLSISLRCGNISYIFAYNHKYKKKKSCFPFLPEPCMPNSFLVFKILFYSNHKTGTQQAISISIIQCYASLSYLAGSNQIEVLIECRDHLIGSNEFHLALSKMKQQIGFRCQTGYSRTARNM